MDVNQDRELVILTWSKAARKYKPQETQKNYSVEMISINDINLKRVTGKNEVVQVRIMMDPKFTKLLDSIVQEIETNNYMTISICCTHGRHRSVAAAELLKKLYYPQASINHLDL